MTRRYTRLHWKWVGSSHDGVKISCTYLGGPSARPGTMSVSLPKAQCLLAFLPPTAPRHFLLTKPDGKMKPGMLGELPIAQNAYSVPPTNEWAEGSSVLYKDRGGSPLDQTATSPTYLSSLCRGPVFSHALRCHHGPLAVWSYGDPLSSSCSAFGDKCFLLSSFVVW